MSDSSSSHQSQQGSSFRSYPQKFPRAQKKADEAIAHIFRIVQKGPRSLSALVVDTSYHLTQGYVLCQIQSTVARVYGVPYGSVVAQMRVFCRQIGASATNRAYLFDGYAPNVSTLKQTGSILLAQYLNGLTSSVCTTNVGGMPTIGGLASAIGYYWHCFFYFPELPKTTIALYQMTNSGGTTNVLSLDYLPTGLLRFHSQDGHGYTTTVPVAPHVAHWVQIQPGLTGSELLVDGVASYVGLLSPTDEPTFTGAAQPYTGSYLSNLDGTQPCALGAWISKIGFGTNYAGGAVIPFSPSVPTDDTFIPNLAVGAGQTTANLYLCTDAPGSTLLSNNATSGGSPLSLTDPYSSLVVTGPY